MQFIAFLYMKSESPDPVPISLIEAEIDEAKRLYSEGFIRQIWNTSDRVGACLMIEASNEDVVLQNLQSLPLVHADALEIASITALAPYPGFSPRL